MVSEPDIQSILGAQPEAERAASSLVDAANAAGGLDNTTVIVIDVVEGDAPAAPAETDATLTDAAETQVIETSDATEVEPEPKRRRGFLRRRR
jgi:serine/threonine protein phosphatase PrpC